MKALLRIFGRQRVMRKDDKCTILLVGDSEAAKQLFRTAEFFAQKCNAARMTLAMDGAVRKEVVLPLRFTLVRVLKFNFVRTAPVFDFIVLEWRAK